MGKNLAIKGHSTRGKEVIELLEMMGGEAAATKGFTESYCYYISENTATKYISWDYIGPEEIDKYEIFTLEEFLEKYPFKVGDKAVYEDDNDIVVISEIKWDDTISDIFYNVKRIDEDDCFLCPPELLKPYKETNITDDIMINQITNKVSVIKLKPNVCDDKIELQLGNYEIAFCDGKTYAVRKKSVYPTTYEECCKILDIRWEKNYTQGYKCGLINKFQELFIARNAYWKIAGEEMGLGKPWEPDWSIEDEIKYVIEVYRNNVRKNSQGYTNTILSFPTKEMRDIFYENFKNEIEQCKELL